MSNVNELSVSCVGNSLKSIDIKYCVNKTPPKALSCPVLFSSLLWSINKLTSIKLFWCAIKSSKIGVISQNSSLEKNRTSRTNKYKIIFLDFFW